MLYDHTVGRIFVFFLRRSVAAEGALCMSSARLGWHSWQATGWFFEGWAGVGFVRVVAWNLTPLSGVATLEFGAYAAHTTRGCSDDVLTTNGGQAEDGP